jgi:hypothetical protein
MITKVVILGMLLAMANGGFSPKCSSSTVWGYSGKKLKDPYTWVDLSTCQQSKTGFKANDNLIGGKGSAA